MQPFTLLICFLTAGVWFVSVCDCGWMLGWVLGCLLLFCLLVVSCCLLVFGSCY